MDHLASIALYFFNFMVAGGIASLPLLFITGALDSVLPGEKQ
jgi:hypothetical protein